MTDLDIQAVNREFLLQRVQPALSGLMDGSLRALSFLAVTVGGAIIATVSSALGAAA